MNVEAHSHRKTQWHTASGQDNEKIQSKHPVPHGTPDTWLCVQWGAGVALASPACNFYHLESYWHTAEQHKEPDSHVLVEECLVKGRCCTLGPTPVTKRNGTLPPAKIMRRFSQLTHGSLVPCVVQLCASRIRGDRSCRLRCCWRRKCYPSPPLYTKPSVWCAMGGRIL